MKKCILYIIAVNLIFINQFAFAWKFDEHSLIGTESFEIACARVSREPKQNKMDENRAKIACSKNVKQISSILEADYIFYFSKLYGQASAISGDHISEPEAFLNKDVQRKFASASSYGLLALRNSGHFYPMVVRNWRKYKMKSLDYITATPPIGLNLYDLFEKMLYTHAFADHFLHDSFAAGHMGFNRPASTSSPSLKYHDVQNKKGRKVSNGSKEWVTYGDGNLVDDAKTLRQRVTNLFSFGTQSKNTNLCQSEVRQLLILNKAYDKNLSQYDKFCESFYHVVQASAKSVEDLLNTFIYNKRNSEAELGVADLLPITIVKKNVFRKNYSYIGSGHNGRENLSEINRPVYKKYTLDYWRQSETDYLSRAKITKEFSNETRNFFGGSAEFFLKLDMFTLPIRLQAGASIDGFIDIGYIFPLTEHLPQLFSQDGLFSHEIVMGQISEISGSEKNIYGSYRVNVELGTWYLRGQFGLSNIDSLNKATDNYRYLSFGVGYVFLAGL